MPDFSALQELAANARQKSKERRNGRRATAEVVSHVPKVIDRSVDGPRFVEDIGDVLIFEQGGTEFIYLPEALAMRGVSLERNESVRRKAFKTVACNIPPSDILNIGAGCDTTLVEAFQEGGHAIIATDFALNVVSELAGRVSVPTFAADLVELDALLPPRSLDYVIGNSTLGYVAPAKLRQVTRNIVGIARRGGIFTFDMTPHSDYYLLAQGAKATQTCVNASRPDPQLLLEYVLRLGAVPGVLAAAAYSSRLSIAVQLGVLRVLSQLFTDMGWIALVTWQYLDYAEGQLPFYILRVSPDAQDFGDIPQTEKRIDDFDDLFLKQIDFSRYQYIPSAMDRERAMALAPLLGIQCSPRDAPLQVIQKAMDIVYENQIDAAAELDVARLLAPSKIADALMPHVQQGKGYARPRRMRTAVELDQTLHAQIVEGTFPGSESDAKLMIDQLYDEERQRALSKEEARLAAVRQEKEKQRRKQQKANRKRNRRK